MKVGSIHIDILVINDIYVKFYLTGSRVRGHHESRHRLPKISGCRKLRVDQSCG